MIKQLKKALKGKHRFFPQYDPVNNPPLSGKDIADAGFKIEFLKDYKDGVKILYTRVPGQVLGHWIAGINGELWDSIKEGFQQSGTVDCAKYAILRILNADLSNGKFNAKLTALTNKYKVQADDIIDILIN